MTDHTKHNAKIAQEFWKKVEEGVDPTELWDNCLSIVSEGAYKTYKQSINDFERFRFCYASYKFKWKPETITIHGREVPKPMTKTPKDDYDYFYYDTSECKADICKWEGDRIDHQRFRLGIFDNEEDCEKFAEAYYRPWQELVE